ncbi:MAG: helix-turn-helix transcriptional regulator [Bacteroidota bacterium]
MDRSEVGKQLKELRDKADLSQDRLAERSTLSRAQIISIEKGKGNPTLESLLKYLNGVNAKMKFE